jgi:hypothetical protein
MFKNDRIGRSPLDHNVGIIAHKCTASIDGRHISTSGLGLLLSSTAAGKVDLIGQPWLGCGKLPGQR